MAITLTYNATTLTLPEQLDWSDELSWQPVVAQTEYSSTGALMIDTWVKQAGRPITLVGSQERAWISRANSITLQAWASIAGAELALVLRGQTYTVAFDHSRTPAFDSRPINIIVNQRDGDVDGDDWHVPTIKFLAL